MPSGRGNLGLPLGPSSTGSSSGASSFLRFFASARGRSSGFSALGLSPLPRARDFASGAGDPSALPEELRSSSAAAATMASCFQRALVFIFVIFGARETGGQTSRIGKRRSRVTKGTTSTKRRLETWRGGGVDRQRCASRRTGGRAFGTRRS